MASLIVILFALLLLLCTGKVDDVSKVQTLLFSATLPAWVKQVCFFGDVVNL
uniref:Dead box ATP-dependent RNA helicase n=1 Tax=Rhizophora mucronata TaxID=61149 RepID=A0A2P2MME4_RHIMU